MKVKVKVYDRCKYDKESKKIAEVKYDVVDYKVEYGEEATKIGEQTDENSRDEYNEYLVLYLADCNTSTFCNSHVDLFID